MELGRVVGSSDQSDYLVHVHAAGDVPTPPSTFDRAFGQFVDIPVDERDHLIGVIYSTQLVNPAYGYLGPRLSTEQELPVFSPDYLQETATILGVSLIGTAHRNAQRVDYQQGTPVLAPAVDAPVNLLDEPEVRAFHRPADRLALAYFPRLLARPFPSLPDLLCAIIDRLIAAFPVERPRLEVARQNIRWRAVVGGDR
jgi:hypothetical protein